jgi:hypothetical protein
MTTPNTTPAQTLDAATLVRILRLAHIATGIMLAQHALSAADLRAVQVVEAVMSGMIGEKDGKNN